MHREALEWRDVTLGDLAEVNPESLGVGTRPDLRFRYIDLTSVDRGFVNWAAVRQEVYRSAPSRARRVVSRSDVLFGTVRPALQSHGFVDDDTAGACVASTGFAVIRSRPNVVAPRFLYHAVLSSDLLRQSRRVEVGSNYPAVNESDVRGLRVCCPPLPEQRRIAAILDTLDEAIRSTEQVIAKLQQVKKGLLHDLLTRGIDENGELRDPERHPEQFQDSPLGRIPKAWDLGPFGSLCASSAFGPRFPGELYAENGAVATLRTTDMDDEGRLNLLTMPRARIAESAVEPHLLRPGDLVISRSGTCGIAAVFPGHSVPVVPGAFLIRFRLRDSRHSELYRRYFNSAAGRPRIDRLAVGGVQKNIKGSSVLALTVPLLPPAEVEMFRSRVDATEGPLDQNTVQLSKLRELKQGLMDDLLTGRVRVTVADGDADAFTTHTR